MKWIVTPRAGELVEFVAQACPGSTAALGRAAGPRGHTVMLTFANDDHARLIEAFLAEPVVASPSPLPNASTEDPSGYFGGTKARLSFYSRNAVAWLASRSWGNGSKKEDVKALKQAKAALDPTVIEAAATDLATVLRRQVGAESANVCVTHVACGHSQRPDCFACRVAQAVAERLGFTFRKVFRDRFVKGVSHPKEFKHLAPIEVEALPQEPLVIVIDDVATSGWHMEEALSTLRAVGTLATGIVWISGNVD